MTLIIQQILSSSPQSPQTKADANKQNHTIQTIDRNLPTWTTSVSSTQAEGTPPATLSSTPTDDEHVHVPYPEKTLNAVGSPGPNHNNPERPEEEEGGRKSTTAVHVDVPCSEGRIGFFPDLESGKML